MGGSNELQQTPPKTRKGCYDTQVTKGDHLGQEPQVYHCIHRNCQPYCRYQAYRTQVSSEVRP
jgi:hypothetical protein